ncbi:hypothetical protein [Robertkochia flava]|uniref:hypothetical protein n=1 Tax=Robertkochia flava TaxID=3447986 RepID=UPI001CCB2EC2|nr:hypothetical protein [Robertkochia marina]
MKTSLMNYRHYFLFGIVVMIFGIILATTWLGNDITALGSGLIAFGALLVIIGVKQIWDNTEYRNHLGDHW